MDYGSVLNWLRIIFCDSFDVTISILACVVSVGSMIDGWVDGEL